MSRPTGDSIALAGSLVTRWSMRNRPGVAQTVKRKSIAFLRNTSDGDSDSTWSAAKRHDAVSRGRLAGRTAKDSAELRRT